MKTYSIKAKDIDNSWFLIDATNHTLGRLSSKVAHILRGKNKVNYTPHMNMSDYVVIINSDKIKVSGNKEDKKEYWSHSRYPGSGKKTLYKTVMKNNSDLILYNAIKGMLPSNKLSNQLIKHLKVYKDNKHPHSSQKPEILEI